MFSNLMCHMSLLLFTPNTTLNFYIIGSNIAFSMIYIANIYTIIVDTYPTCSYWGLNFNYEKIVQLDQIKRGLK